MEAPYYGVSTINIGDRQKNRLRSKLIKNTSFSEKKIVKLIKFVENRKINKRNFLVKVDHLKNFGTTTN